jgi:wobble nucleotide-excising tRNase
MRDAMTDLIRSWDALAKIIGEHNTKTAQFDEERTGARDKITNHFLSEMHAEVTLLDDLTTADKAALKQEQLGAEGQLSLEALQQSIAEKKAQISNSHKAGEKLTTLLHTFLARAELTFKSSDEGYRLMRHGKPARRLSDGERTAIAFIYFIVQLGDQEFDLEDGIVVIDDPVSSLDASSIYQAFAFLKNAVQDAKQVFLFTHNFGFLRLVLNWLTHGQLRRHSRFYMLVCRSEADGRRTALRALDKTLIDHPTEYHFLFKTLAEFRGDGTIAACYHIPNVARKILETFLDFHVPGTAKVYSKLNTLDFDENKRTAIYKFTNDLSHRTGQGFEPGLVDESQKNANYLLEMIEHVAPKHYQGMLAAIGNSSA